MAFIETRGLTKRYADGVVALDRLDLRVEAGEIYALLGPNGAGKTTTISLLLNYIPPTAGEAYVAGFDCVRQPVEVRRRVAYIPENVALYENFTAYQNLAAFARLAGKRPPGLAEAATVLESVGLPTEALSQRVRAFSRGMRQRLAIAIAIVKAAPVLLLDEPTAGLDPRATAEFYDRIRRLREEGRAILLATHDVFRVQRIADRVGILRQGRLVVELRRAELVHVDLERIYLTVHGEASD
jgi:ABC-2 type transport system ATP-binding protein